jgi:hypothetical protein
VVVRLFDCNADGSDTAAGALVRLTAGDAVERAEDVSELHPRDWADCVLDLAPSPPELRKRL